MKKNKTDRPISVSGQAVLRAVQPNDKLVPDPPRRITFRRKSLDPINRAIRQRRARNTRRCWPIAPASKTGSGSFHLRSAQGSTNNRLHPATGAINLRAAVDPEAVRYAFDDRFQISAFALFPRCRAVECALRARHRRHEPLAFRHDWLPARSMPVAPISQMRSVTRRVVAR